jgi:asparagine synthase (glutamine-hydrolysing)
MLVAPPARAERVNRNDIVAWLYPGSPGWTLEDAEGPEIRIDATGMQITVGPLPQYPLFYFRAPEDSFVLASSRFEVVALACSERRLRLGRLASLTAWRPGRDLGTTIFEDVHRVRPCERVDARRDGVGARTRVPQVAGTYLRASPDEVAGELRRELSDAVARAIAPAKRVAVLVGGGLDSSGVLAMAARHRGAGARELDAIALGWPGPGDDRPHLDALCRDLGIVPVRLTPTDAAKWVLPSLCLDGLPDPLASTCLDALLCETARAQGADVVLSGTSGDAILGGAPPGFALLLRRGHPLRALWGAARLQRPWSMPLASRVRSLVIVPALRTLVPAPLRRLRRRRARGDAWTTHEFRRLVEEGAVGWDGFDLLPDTPAGWFSLRCSSIDRATVTDLGGQVLSVTRCAPHDVYLDRRFVEFMSKVDPVLLHHGGTYRGLYRLAMRGLLPESVRTRTDKALFEPAIATAFLAAGALGPLRDLSSMREMAALGLVDPKAFRPEFDACASAIERGMLDESDETMGKFFKVWPFLSAEATVRHFAAESGWRGAA